MSGEEVGRIIGEASTLVAPFISKKPPREGDYVVLEYEGFKVLGMIEYVLRVNDALVDVHDENVIDKIRILDGGRNEYVKGVVRLLGDINRPREGYPLPRIPPPPGTKLIRAGRNVLESIFGKNDRRVLRIGTLLSRRDVPVYLDVNKMVTRHLAILAITGAGKSNTVAVISEELGRLGATLVIFDMHADYVHSSIGNLNPVQPRLNPYHMSLNELYKLMRIDSSAHKQARIFRAAYKVARQAIGGGATSLGPESFLGSLKYMLYSIVGLEPPEELARIGRELEKLEDYDKLRDIFSARGFKDSAFGVLSKLEDFEERLAGVIDPSAPDALSLLERGRVNAVDLSRLDEDDADIVVSHYLRRILGERKKHRVSGEAVESMAAPVFVILEEAHILAPKDRPTLSKYWIGRIAREGRKFGVGICLVSQRPKGLDVDSLSQVNNMIILKLVEPGDQRHVQQASEQLSEDLLRQLPSLNVGEAVIIGPMTPFPVLVRVDKFRGELGGADIDVLGEWGARGGRGEDTSYEDLIEVE